MKHTKFSDLDREAYISLATFRRDGRAVVSVGDVERGNSLEPLDDPGDIRFVHRPHGVSHVVVRADGRRTGDPGARGGAGRQAR